jgi:arylsulfatase
MTEGRLAYAHNFVALEEHLVESPEALSPGRHQVEFHFERTGEHRGVGHLLVDGTETARVDIPRFTLTRFSLTGAGLTCGYSDGLPVTRRYAAPFRFTGGLEEAVVEVDGPPWEDPEAEAEHAMSVQ